MNQQETELYEGMVSYLDDIYEKGNFAFNDVAQKVVQKFKAYPDISPTLQQFVADNVKYAYQEVLAFHEGDVATDIFGDEVQIKANKSFMSPLVLALVAFIGYKVIKGKK